MRYSSYWSQFRAGPFHWPAKAFYGRRLAYANHPCNTHNDTREQGDKHLRHKLESRWHGRGGKSFGVRRPLRYLAHHLDLDESQTRRMATVLNQLKTEQEQAALDEKRTLSALATLLEDGTPTLDEARAVLTDRVKSAEQLQEETARAVVAISDFLDDDQREEFINLLVTGSVTL